MPDRNVLTPRRLPSIDIARGAILILMALDHVRIYFSSAAFSAVDPERTNLLLFLMRWVTHFCAPGFFLIAGIAIYVYQQKCGDRRQVSSFLISRGLWLILLEVTIIGFGWSFNAGWFWLGVIWSLGVSFLLMSVLLRVSPRIVLWASLAIILLHAIPVRSTSPPLNLSPALLPPSFTPAARSNCQLLARKRSCTRYSRGGDDGSRLRTGRRFSAAAGKTWPRPCAAWIAGHGRVPVASYQQPLRQSGDCISRQLVRAVRRC